MKKIENVKLAKKRRLGVANCLRYCNKLDHNNEADVKLKTKVIIRNIQIGGY